MAVTDINNRFITGLVEIAKKQGIEAALATETRDRVYRQIFPTALEYTAFCNSVIETVKQYAGCITDAVSELDMSEITGPLTNLIAKSVEFAQEKYLKKAEQDAKRIYGGK